MTVPREQIMSVLYDITLVIGSEVSLRPMLTKTLQRLLYHTSFPTGLVFLELPEGDDGALAVTLDLAIGDFGFAGQMGRTLNLPGELVLGGPEVREAPDLLGALTAATRPYTVFLRLPIDGCGVILLLAPRQPATQLPLTQVFRPVMANLARAILLCRHNDAYADNLVAERDRAQQSLAESEDTFGRMASVAQDAIVMIDDQGHIDYWNAAAERFFGYNAQEAMGRDAHDLLAPKRYHSRFRQGFARFRTSGEGPVVGKILETEGRRKDGSEFPVEVSISALSLQGRWHAVGLLRDVTERHSADLALRRANLALKTLSGCNSILVRAEDESRLLADICNLIVQTGGYRSAWVAYAEDDPDKRLRATASAGVDQTYLEMIDATWADGPQGRGPASRALRTGEPQLVLDLVGEITSADHRRAVIERGYTSAIALPLKGPDGVFGVLKVYAEVREAFGEEEIALLTELADDLAFGILTLRTRLERRRLEAAEHESAERLKRALLGTIQAVAVTVEKRDPYTAGHQQQVARLAVAMARELGWSPHQIEGVRLGAMIHDIGKIYIPSEILSRPGKLMDLEYQLIQSHPQVGYEILQGVELPWPVADIIVQHHERLDGSGYPKGLKGDAILPEARLLAVADVVEAMAVHRPYRPALGVEAGLEQIIGERGVLFDPAMVDACVTVVRKRGFRFD